VQQRIFSLLGIEPEDAQERFGFLLDAFRFGAPPHAGFAFGIDRLTAILAGEDNIREVIAFPKTQSGTDPLTGAPTAIDPGQLKELGLSVLPKPKK
jgi:aspartyl-tRNA synthetase